MDVFFSGIYTFQYTQELKKMSCPEFNKLALFFRKLKYHESDQVVIYEW
jgi:hypothetical protein